MKAMKKKLRKFLLMLSCGLLLMSLSVGVTVAYLTSTDSVTNTFTVGNVKITLDETLVLPYDDGSEDHGKISDPASAVPTKANEYRLFPGREYDKDPTVHVAADSERCYVFVKVDNGIAAIETTETNKTIAAQMAALGWKQLMVDGTAVENVYFYGKKTEDGDIVTKETDLRVFNTFTIRDDVVGGTGTEEGKLYLGDYAGAKVIVTAYAVQAEGFASAAAAWDGAQFK